MTARSRWSLTQRPANEGFKNRPFVAQTGTNPVSTHIMKANLAPSLLVAATLLAGQVLLAAESKSDAVTVSFHESDKFTDACSRWGGETDQDYLDLLSTHLQKSAPRLLAAGQKLEVTFTDIDLAGDFIPGNVRSQDIRVIKDIYIPRQKLIFRLVGADGQVVKEGERRLSDMNFMNNLRLAGRGEPLFYDKALLTDWLEKELKD